MVKREFLLFIPQVAICHTVLILCSALWSETLHLALSLNSCKKLISFKVSFQLMQKWRWVSYSLALLGPQAKELPFVQFPSAVICDTVL